MTENDVARDGWHFAIAPTSGLAGVVVIHEVFGRDAYVLSVAESLAKEGIAAAAVDLYSGRIARNLDEAFALRQALTPERVLGAVRAGADLLRERIVPGAVVGALGFCMGGGFALLAGCHLPLSFTIDFYGRIEEARDVKNLAGPLLLMLASEDARITPWALSELLPACLAEKKRVEVELYPNVKHAFHRPGWEGHNAEAARDAWVRTVRFVRDQFPVSPLARTDRN